MTSSGSQPTIWANAVLVNKMPPSCAMASTGTGILSRATSADNCFTVQPRFGVSWERRGRCMVGILQAGTACVHECCVTCFFGTLHYVLRVLNDVLPVLHARRLGRG